VRYAARVADPEQPVSDVGTMPDVLGEETASRVTQLRLLGALAAIALLIGGVGVHGLLSFAVSQRAQELAVRRALGAQARGIVGLVLGEGMALAALGIVTGVALADPLARAVGALLADVRPADPATIAAAAVRCLATALDGCLRPAIRAAHVDPIAALRSE
jgi:putative ABC transport system permease protein